MTTSISTARPPATLLPARIALAIWAPAVVILVGATMVAHWAPLPVPEPTDRLGAVLDTVRADGEDGWAAFHVLYADCPCSQRLVTHLLESERPESVSEVVLLVGEDAPLMSALEGAGFRIVPTSSDELRDVYGIESAPLFVVVDPKGHALYSGGYTGHKQGLDYADLDVLAGLIAGADVDSLPVYGCGVSNALQAELDPLGIKY